MSEVSQWDILLARYKKNELYRNDVIDLLRCHVTPPPEALDLIAKILAGENRPLKGGPPPKNVLTEDGFVRAEFYVWQQVDALHLIYNIPIGRAEEIVSDRYGISISQLRKWRTTWADRDDHGRAEYLERTKNAWRNAQ